MSSKHTDNDVLEFIAWHILWVGTDSHRLPITDFR